MSYDRILQRYREDATFHACVDSMSSMIENGSLTPEDVRDAAFMAACDFQMRHPQPLRIAKVEIERLARELGMRIERVT